ncbi:MAG: hypothetical protein ABSH36_15785 [Solirubrobacteraceae bacterium]
MSTSRSRRALLAPLFHATALSGGGMDRARGWLGRSEFSQPTEILRNAGAQIALEELSGVAAQAVGDYRTSVLGTAQVALAWASRAAVRDSADPNLTPQIDLGELLAQQGTLYVISPSRIQQELAPLIAAVLDAQRAQDRAGTPRPQRARRAFRSARLRRPPRNARHQPSPPSPQTAWAPTSLRLRSRPQGSVIQHDDLSHLTLAERGL